MDIIFAPNFYDKVDLGERAMFLRDSTDHVISTDRVIKNDININVC